jgi:hypothetical protein
VSGWPDWSEAGQKVILGDREEVTTFPGCSDVEPPYLWGAEEEAVLGFLDGTRGQRL